jgi:tRNA(Ile)-lysidine synthase
MKHSLILNVAENIKSLGVTKKQYIGVGISGGVDSVVLLDLLVNAGFLNIVLLHVNYGLRGTESDEDQSFVEQLAKKYACKCIVFSAQNLIEKGPAVQEKARNIRYDWFWTLINDHSIDLVVTAHHEQDVAETVLLNLLRKTGLKGLRGIVQTKQFVRPLTQISKSKILDYANSQNLRWRDDSSNLSIDYTRNFLRHKVLPVMQELNPKAVHHIAQSALFLEDNFELLQFFMKKLFAKNSYEIAPCVTKIDAQFLIDYPQKELLLFMFLTSKGFLFSQCQEIVQAVMNQKSGAIWYSDSFDICMHYPFIYCVNNTLFTTDFSSEFVLESSHVFEFDHHQLNQNVNSDDHFFQTLIPKRFHGQLFSWRCAKRGDRIALKTGSKKVSDVLNEAKVPILFRPFFPVLVYQNKVIWVPGIRNDPAFFDNGLCDDSVLIKVKSLFLLR